MTFAEQDQLAAERGMTLPENPARDEAMRYGYDPMPEFQRSAAFAFDTGLRRALFQAKEHQEVNK